MKFIYDYQRWLDLCGRSTYSLGFVLRFCAAILSIKCTHGLSGNHVKRLLPETGEMGELVKHPLYKHEDRSWEVETGGSRGSLASRFI